MQFIEDEIMRLREKRFKHDVKSGNYHESVLHNIDGKIQSLEWVLEKLEEPATIHDIEEGPLQSTWNVIDRQEFEQLKRQMSGQVADLTVKFDSLRDNFNTLITKVDQSFGEAVSPLYERVDVLEGMAADVHPTIRACFKTLRERIDNLESKF